MPYEFAAKSIKSATAWDCYINNALNLRPLYYTEKYVRLNNWYFYSNNTKFIDIVFSWGIGIELFQLSFQTVAMSFLWAVKLLWTLTAQSLIDVYCQIMTWSTVGTVVCKLAKQS